MTADEVELLGLVKDDEVPQPHRPRRRYSPDGVEASAKIGMSVFGVLFLMVTAFAAVIIAVVALFFMAFFLFPRTGNNVIREFRQADDNLNKPYR